MEYRGTGRTTQQMNAAPRGAVFVWCNGDITYPKGLAQDLKREDILVRPLSWLKRDKVIGQTFAVVVDHAAKLTAEGHDALNYVRVRAASKTPNVVLSGAHGDGSEAS